MANALYFDTSAGCTTSEPHKYTTPYYFVLINNVFTEYMSRCRSLALANKENELI